MSIKHRFRVLAASVGAWAAMTAGAQAQTAALPAPEAFFGRAEVQAAALSPSGRWMAVTARLSDGRYGVAVVDVTGETKPVIVARAPTLDVYRAAWVNDDRLVFDTVDFEQGSGNQLYAPGLFSVRRDGSELRVLVKLRGNAYVGERMDPSDRALPYNHTLYHVPTTGGDEVIVVEHRFDPDTGERIGRLPKRVNVVNGRSTSAAMGAATATDGWVFDRAGNARVAVEIRDGRARVLWHKDATGDARSGWSEIGAFSYLDAPWSPHSVDADGRLYVLALEPASGERVLKRFDFEAGRPEAAPLARTPGFDFSGEVVTEPATGRFLGVRLVTDAETTVWQDARLKALQQEIDRRLPGRVNSIDCSPCAGPDLSAIVRSWSDRQPAEYWVWRGETSEPKVWRLVGSELKGIVAKQMGTRDLHRFAARDGLSIPVWVTTPAPSAPRTGDGDRKRSAVVLVHGGPWVRGASWDFDPMVQFLASRGYVVIEPEFRGSRGYGAALYRAGWKQWGRKMQDDLADAVAWANTKGLIDPSRVCIAGASYGGYATLMGLVRHPEVFKCGVAWVAVSDPAMMMKWSALSDFNEESRSHSWPQLVGHPVNDAELLRDASAVNHAARISAPLLLAHGGWDRRVPMEQFTRMRDALQAAGKKPELVVYDEGHGWLTSGNQIDFARRVERFLGEHLR